MDASHSHKQCTSPRDGKRKFTHTNYLPRSCLPQRNHQCKSTLFFPPGRRFIHCRKCFFCRLETNALFLCKGNVWRTNESSFQAFLFSFYGTKCRDGYFVSHLWRKRLQCL